MTFLVFPVGIAAAVLLGLGYVLQQRVAATAPLSELMTVRLLLDLMHRRLWWGGIGRCKAVDAPAFIFPFRLGGAWSAVEAAIALPFFLFIFIHYKFL